MKVSKIAWLAAAAIGMTSGIAQAQQNGTYAANQSPVSQVSWATASCDCGEPVCGCEVVADPGCGCETACDCEVACDTGCDSIFGGGLGLGIGAGLAGLGGSGPLGDPYSLFGEYNGIAVGGWTQFGYHSQDGGFRFNQHADRVNLHQGWLYAEKAIDTSRGFDIGGRFDYVYGVDAQDTQAFGIDNGHWDNQWDNGIYGHAIPQAYVEAGYGDWSVKVGHFFTIIGFEVVTAPDNFFYSHAYTMNNSEPFTHTGALATYNASEDVTLYGGYVMGWDSGFEDNGDAFLGGFSLALMDDLQFTYTTIMGRFGEDFAGGGERGFQHSVVFDAGLSDNLRYVFQSDYLDTENSNGQTARNTIGINQYLFYTLNERWAVGARAEWWNLSEDSVGFYGDDANLAALAAITDQAGRADVYALTMGLNYRPHANVIIRPEVRWDWVKENRDVLNAADITVNEQNDPSQTTFGLDTIILF